jgi:CubicO group peptidase (beta-lactamase class C family)
MRAILECAFAALLITSVVGLRATSRSATVETNRASAASQTSPDLARMEDIVQSYVSDKKFMGCVLAARGSNVLLNKGYGFANLEWEIPNSPSAKFRLGSVTKQFTAAAILLLQSAGN